MMKNKSGDTADQGHKDASGFTISSEMTTGGVVKDLESEGGPEVGRMDESPQTANKG